MNYNTIFVGMDVHKESFSLYACTIEVERVTPYQRRTADHKNGLKYLELGRKYTVEHPLFLLV